MKILTETSKKFGTLAVNNLFVGEYLPALSGDAVRLYLTLLYYAEFGVRSDETAIANVLGVSVQVISAAMIELESKGLISREDDGLHLQELAEKHLRDHYNPRTAPRTEAGEGSGTDRTHLLRAISDRFFGGQMSQSWYNDIVLWAETYGFCDEVVFMIFQQNADKVSKRPYMRKVMENYGERGIRTVEQMNTYLQKRDEYVKVRNRVVKNLNLQNYTTYQEEYIEKWFYTYGYGFDIIELALKEGARVTNPGFSLYDRILTDWHEAGLTDAQAVKEHIKNRRAAQSQGGGQTADGGAGTKPAGRGKTGTEGRSGRRNGGNSSNYDQRSYDSGFYDSVYGEDQ